jgi:hypothetical protein
VPLRRKGKVIAKKRSICVSCYSILLSVLFLYYSMWQAGLHV